MAPTFKKNPLIFRFICSIVSFLFLFNCILPPNVIAEVIPQLLNLPVPGTMVSLSDKYMPTLINGIIIHPENPLKFNFIVTAAEDSSLDHPSFKNETKKLVKYFLAGLTVPENEMWVNLSPYEKDRIIPQNFGLTEMGRDLLAQDYMLKQISASLMYPDGELGQGFWEKVHNKALEKFGTIDIPMDTFNKIWIVPDKAVIYENGNTAFIAESHLKVMLEEDYLALINQKDNKEYETSALTSEVIRQVIVPEIENEVNNGKTFANLRQIYNSVILSCWYKLNLKQTLLGQVYVNKGKTKGIDNKDKQINEKIYNQYLESFKKGVYNYIREDYDPSTQEVLSKKYFSGGTNIGDAINKIEREKISDSTMISAVEKLVSERTGSVELDLVEVSRDPFDEILSEDTYGLSTSPQAFYPNDFAMLTENDIPIIKANIFHTSNPMIVENMVNRLIREQLWVDDIGQELMEKIEKMEFKSHLLISSLKYLERSPQIFPMTRIIKLIINYQKDKSTPDEVIQLLCNILNKYSKYGIVNRVIESKFYLDEGFNYFMQALGRTGADIIFEWINNEAKKHNLLRKKQTVDSVNKAINNIQKLIDPLILSVADNSNYFKILDQIEESQVFLEDFLLEQDIIRALTPFNQNLEKLLMIFKEMVTDQVLGEINQQRIDKAHEIADNLKNFKFIEIEIKDSAMISDEILNIHIEVLKKAVSKIKKSDLRNEPRDKLLPILSDLNNIIVAWKKDLTVKQRIPLLYEDVLIMWNLLTDILYSKVLQEKIDIKIPELIKRISNYKTEYFQDDVIYDNYFKAHVTEVKKYSVTLDSFLEGERVSFNDLALDVRDQVKHVIEIFSAYEIILKANMFKSGKLKANPDAKNLISKISTVNSRLKYYSQNKTIDITKDLKNLIELCMPFQDYAMSAQINFNFETKTLISDTKTKIREIFKRVNEGKQLSLDDYDILAAYYSLLNNTAKKESDIKIKLEYLLKNVNIFCEMVYKAAHEKSVKDKESFFSAAEKILIYKFVSIEEENFENIKQIIKKMQSAIENDNPVELITYNSLLSRSAIVLLNSSRKNIKLQKSMEEFVKHVDKIINIVRDYKNADENYVLFMEYALKIGDYEFFESDNAMIAEPNLDIAEPNIKRFSRFTLKVKLILNGFFKLGQFEDFNDEQKQRLNKLLNEFNEIEAEFINIQRYLPLDVEQVMQIYYNSFGQYLIDLGTNSLIDINAFENLVYEIQNLPQMLEDDILEIGLNADINEKQDELSVIKHWQQIPDEGLKKIDVKLIIDLLEGVSGENFSPAIVRKVLSEIEEKDLTLVITVARAVRGYMKGKTRADIVKGANDYLTVVIENTGKKGGIDMNPVMLDLQIKRDINGVPLPLNDQPIINMNIEGFIPVIIQITPVLNIPLLLGLSENIENSPENQDFFTKAQAKIFR